MSIVNQMLRDLEMQRGRFEPAPAGLGVHIPVSRQPTREIPVPMIMAALLIMIMLAGYLFWKSIDLSPLNAGQAEIENVMLQSEAIENAQPINVDASSLQPQDEIATPLADSSDITTTTQPPAGKVTEPRNLVQQGVISRSQWATITVAEPVSAQQVERLQVQQAPATQQQASTAVPAQVAVVQPERLATVAPQRPQASAANLIDKRFRPLTAAQQAEQDFSRAKQYFDNGSLALAEQHLKQALATQAKHIAARELFIAVLQKQQRYDELTDVLLNGINLHPQHTLFVQLYARLLLDQGQTGQAIKLLENFSADVKQNPEHYAMLAAAYQRNAQHEKAIQTYQYVLSVFPHRSVWWLGMGISQQARNDSVAALQSFRRAHAGQGLSPELQQFAQQRIDVLQRSN